MFGSSLISLEVALLGMSSVEVGAWGGGVVPPPFPVYANSFSIAFH